jgi:hypothetical protein
MQHAELQLRFPLYFNTHRPQKHALPSQAVNKLRSMKKQSKLDAYVRVQMTPGHKYKFDTA